MLTEEAEVKSVRFFFFSGWFWLDEITSCTDQYNMVSIKLRNVEVSHLYLAVHIYWQAF